MLCDAPTRDFKWFEKMRVSAQQITALSGHRVGCPRLYVSNRCTRNLRVRHPVFTDHKLSRISVGNPRVGKESAQRENPAQRWGGPDFFFHTLLGFFPAFEPPALFRVRPVQAPPRHHYRSSRLEREP